MFKGGLATCRLPRPPGLTRKSCMCLCGLEKATGLCWLLLSCLHRPKEQTVTQVLWSCTFSTALVWVGLPS